MTIQLDMTCVAVHGETSQDVAQRHLDAVTALEPKFAVMPSEKWAMAKCEVTAVFEGPRGFRMEFRTNDWDEAAKFEKGKTFRMTFFAV